MTTLLANLRAARNMLDLTYVKWTMDDMRGGHCAVGVVAEVAGTIDAGGGGLYVEMLTKLNATVRALHPELVGASGPRDMSWACPDKFDEHPLVYVNNQLGKEATLAVFDAAILDLEIAEAKDKVEVREVVNA